MLFRNILRSLGPDSSSKKRSITPPHSSSVGISRNRRRRPLRLEPLEDRQMLSITFFVDADSTAVTPDGLNWASAYSDLQSALDRAAELNSDVIPNNDVEAIWIAEGTYRPTTELEPGDARTASFSLLDDVSLYGGFAGTEATLADRNLSAHETILSGDLGVLDDVADNAYTVVYCGENIEATLDGLWITDGNANYGAGSVEDVGRSAKNSGGGLYNKGTLIITNGTIQKNVAVYGSGIYNEGRMTITDSTISENMIPLQLGFLAATDSQNSEMTDESDSLSVFFIGDTDEESNQGTLTIVNSSLPFIVKLITNSGGGIYNEGNLEVYDSTVSSNTATNGGGIYNEGNLNIGNTIFQDNKATYGAGIANHGEIKIARSQFQCNLISCIYAHAIDMNGVGAGIYNYDTGTANITNSLFTENKGQGIVNQGQMVIINSTIVANRAVIGAGVYAYDNEGAVVELYNSIVAGNGTREGAWGFQGDAPDVNGYVIGSNNLIGNGTGLLNLVNGINGNQIGTAESPIDPMLRAWSQLDTSLSPYDPLPDSPALDAGSNELAAYPSDTPLTTDLYGNARISGNAVDIGAVESGNSNTFAQTYVVTSLDNTIAEDGVLTFIEAFLAASSNHAVGDAVAGSFLEQDIIQFADGLRGTILVDGELVISDDLRIESPNAGYIIFDSQGQNRVFTIAPDVSATLSGITITGGAADKGGGIYNLGILTVTNSIISGNTVLDDGGGIYNAGVLAIINSSILNNSTPEQYEYPSTPGMYVLYEYNPCSGGGVYNSGSMTVTNTTIAGNTAEHGGGICNEDGTLTVTNSTISENSFGICCAGDNATTTVNNTIVAENIEGDINTVWQLRHHFNSNDRPGNPISGCHNLIGDGSNQVGLVDGVNGNQVGTTETPIDPKLSELLHFGKSWQWGYYPLFDSPAINAGDNELVPDGVTADIAGNLRVFENIVDIGACEGHPYVLVIWPVTDVYILPDYWQPGTILSPKENILFVPPAVLPRVATVPRRSELPPRRFIMPMPMLTDTVLAQSSWSTADLASVAKEVQATSAKKSTDASDAVFALDLTLYADFD